MISEGNIGGSLVEKEMERDSLIGHGAAGLLQDRLRDCSDAYKAVYCYNCGIMAVVDVKNFSLEDPSKNLIRCMTCNNTKKFGTLVIPYVFKLLTHLLWVLGYNPRLIMHVLQALEEVPYQPREGPQTGETVVETESSGKISMVPLVAKKTSEGRESETSAKSSGKPPRKTASTRQRVSNNFGSEETPLSKGEEEEKTEVSKEKSKENKKKTPEKIKEKPKENKKKTPEKLKEKPKEKIKEKPKETTKEKKRKVSKKSSKKSREESSASED
jgi:hypothetical protein